MSNEILIAVAIGFAVGFFLAPTVQRAFNLTEGAVLGGSAGLIAGILLF